MIQTAEKVKALIRNLAKGDSNKAQILLRNYGMERFLERISISRYKDNFILKGGVLVSSMVGLDSRATMDIDTTVRGIPLSVSEAKAFVEEITSISLPSMSQTGGIAMKQYVVGALYSEAEIFAD